MTATRETRIALVAALAFAVCLGLGLIAMRRRERMEAAQAALAQRISSIREAILRTKASIATGEPIAVTQQAVQVPQVEPTKATKTHPDFGQFFASHPDLFATYQESLKGRLNQEYDRFLGRLGLSSEQKDRLISLMMRDDENEMDLAMTVEAQGLPGNDPTVREFRQEEKTELQAAEQSILGPQAYGALQDFNRTQGMRGTADDVASLIVASGNPMTGAQTDQLTQVLAEASSSYQHGGPTSLETTDWDQVLSRSAVFLSQPQLDVLTAKIQQVRVAAMMGQFYANQGK